MKRRIHNAVGGRVHRQRAIVDIAIFRRSIAMADQIADVDAMGVFAIGRIGGIGGIDVIQRAPEGDLVVARGHEVVREGELVGFKNLRVGNAVFVDLGDQRKAG